MGKDFEKDEFKTGKGAETKDHKGGNPKSTKGGSGGRKPKHGRGGSGRSGKDGKGGSGSSGSYNSIRSNDIAWYNRSVIYPEATQIPWKVFPGTRLNIETLVPRNTGYEITNFWGTDDYSAPGIMRINYWPVMGIAKDVNDPINRCFTNIYLDMASKISSGITNFQQADLGMFVYSMNNIMSNIAWLERTLGISRLYSNMNYYYPNALLEATGILPSSVFGQQNRLAVAIKNLISNFNSLRIPKFITAFDRAFSLNHNVFADEDDIAAQLFTFVPVAYYQYDDTYDNGVGAVVCKELPLNADNRYRMDVFDLVDIVNGQLNAWRNSSNFTIIASAIQRAYPEGDLIKLDYINEDYVVIPHHDRNMTWQINNAMFTPGVDINSLTIKQDVVRNLLQVQPTVGAGIHLWQTQADNWILNSYDANTSDEFLMESTRLTITTENYSSYAMVKTCGTEIPSNAFIYTIRKESNGDIGTGVIRFSTVAVLEPSQPNFEVDLVNTVQTIPYISKFRNAPRIYHYVGSDSDRLVFGGPTGDLYKWTIIEKQQLEVMNEAAFQSMYDLSKSSFLR